MKAAAFIYFNSIKVQLERKKDYQTAVRRIFQFHKGTIRTHFFNKNECIYDNFNSIKVQLEPVNP